MPCAREEVLAVNGVQPHWLGSVTLRLDYSAQGIRIPISDLFVDLQCIRVDTVQIGATSFILASECSSCRDRLPAAALVFAASIDLDEAVVAQDAEAPCDVASLPQGKAAPKPVPKPAAKPMAKAA